MNRALWGIARVAGWMLALVVVAAALVAALRATAIDDADRAAVALMDRPPPELVGTNGFAALMAADRDVPAARRDDLVAADVAAFTAWEATQAAASTFWASTDAGTLDVDAFEPLATTPVASPPPAAEELCPLSGESCLQRVAADVEGTRALLAKHATRVAAVEAALAADHIANPYGASMVAPLPPLQYLRLPLAAAALDAVDGRVDAAYARTCRLLAAARRTDRQSRNLIDKFVAQGLARGAGMLLLDLRRAQPRAELPGECAAARVPVGIDEAAVCEALRGEFRMQRAQGARMEAQLAGWRPDRWLTRALLVDEDLQAAAMARVLSPSCTEEAFTLAGDGRAPEPVDARLTGIECWAAYISCMLSDIAMPAYARYGERALDHAAVLRLLLAAQRVADGDASPARAAVEAGVPGQPVEFDAATQRASVVLHLPRDSAEATFSVDFAGLAPAAAWRPSDAIAFAAGAHGRPP